MSLSDRPVLESTDALRWAAAEVLDIQDTTLGDVDKYVMRFRGRLRMDSIEAYARVSESFRALGHTALFRKDGEADVILAVNGVINPRPSRVWINFLLFGVTVLSALFVGGLYEFFGAHPDQVEVVAQNFGLWVQTGIREMLTGWPFAVSILSILLAHELGHYFAARYHKVAVTLPYFIPLPFSPFGTLGAFIQLKEPPTNRRVLLDIGIAGPLAGLVVALPVLVYGLITSAPLQALPVNQVGGFEGNSILYVLLKYLIFGKLLPEPASFGNLPPVLYMLRFYILGIFTPGGGQDVLLNQVAWAGWAGLLVTGLNLIPAGQLDGGHALYVLIGRKARRLVPVILVIMIGLGFFWIGWFLWAALIYLLVGRVYAEPLDQITDLDLSRKILAISTLILFVLVFTPIPLV